MEKERKERARVYKSKERLRRSKESDDRSSHAASLGQTRRTMHGFHSTSDDHVPYFALRALSHPRLVPPLLCQSCQRHTFHLSAFYQRSAKRRLSKKEVPLFGNDTVTKDKQQHIMNQTIYGAVAPTKGRLNLPIASQLRSPDKSTEIHTCGRRFD